MVDLKNYNTRIALMLIVFLGFTLAITAQMFNLQVFKHRHYVSLAMANQQGYRELEPRRGEIFIKDLHSGTDFRVATNTTLDTIFADPSLVEDEVFIGDQIAPLLFDVDLALRAEEQRLRDQRKTLPADLSEEELSEILKPKTLEELKREFRDDLVTKLGQQIRPQIILYQNPPDSIREGVRRLALRGIEIRDRDIIAFPPEIIDARRHAEVLSSIVGIDENRLSRLLEGRNRYVVLATKIDPDASEKIREMVRLDRTAFRGLGFEQRTYRFYPENSLAAQVLGFVSSGVGSYGIEAYFDSILKGEKGIFQTMLDGAGRQITVGDDTLIQPAQDGSNVFLSLDRSIQLETERLLRDYVIATRSDAGQVIVMNPKTGEIMAMAHFPTFNPNEFWTALDTEEIFLEEEDYAKIERVVRGGAEEVYLVNNRLTDDKIQLLPVTSELTGEEFFEKFKNDVGSAVYRNRIVQDLFEPGSIFKPITMAVAIDSEIVGPNTTFNDSGPIFVDNFRINNALNRNYGVITMTQALETSNNVAMSWLSRQIGRNLFHNYMMQFGLNRRTDVEFLNEHTGRVRPFTSWAESELVTHSFGQGFTMTPIQMVTAISTIANGGVLMQPTIVDRIEHSNGKTEENRPVTVRRVVSQKTADTISAMMVSTVDRGQSASIRIPGYSVAGKTGTSQTYRNGRPLSGAGTTIASFVGFAPASDPRFVILVKMDRPKTSPWADSTAMPLFNDLTRFLLQYFAIPPDRP